MNGLPLVLLPGLQSDHRSWTAQLRYFEGRREVVVPRGHQFETSIEAMGDVVLSQVPERFHLAAWSMGGYIALAAMRKLASRIASLTLISTSAKAEDPANTTRRLELIERAERVSMRAAATSSIAFSAGDLARVAPDIREAVIESSVELGLDAYRSQQRAIIARPATFDMLALVKVPTLIMAGEDDAVVPPESAREMQKVVRGAELVMIPDCGHCPPFEYPDLVNTRLEDWMARAEATQPAAG